MTEKISGLLLITVAVAMLLSGNQWIALVLAAAGVLFLLYSVGGRNSQYSRRDNGFWSADGGAVSSDNSNGCDNGNSASDSGCGGDGGGGGGD